MTRHGLLVLVLALLVPAPARAAYHALEEIPVESPAYRLVDDLATSYALPSGTLTTRPWTRLQLGEFLDRLVAAAPEAARDPAVVRLRAELTPGGGLAGLEPAISLEDETQAIEISPYGRANYADDRARGAVVRDFRAGAQASAAFGDHTLLFVDGYAGTSSPGPHGNPVQSRHFGLVEGVQFNTYYDRATATWTSGRLLVRAGHTWLRWGPGAWGTMALSDGAPAFDVLDLRATLPAKMSLAWFVASLDPVAQTFLAGHRLELRPASTLDFSLSELARFDGNGSAPLYLMPILPYGVIEKRLLHSSEASVDSLNRFAKNNVMWAADGSWTWRPGVRFYAELAVDDISFSSEKRPRAIAWQVGAHLRHAGGIGAWSLRGEYARVYQFTYSVYHHHDFDFAGFPTGFPLGTDVDLLTGRAEWKPDAAWTWGLEGSVSRKGTGQLGEAYIPGTPVPNNLILQGVLDVDSRGALTTDWSPSPSVQLGLTAGWARVRARDHVVGDDRSGGYGLTRVTLRW